MNINRRSSENKLGPLNEPTQRNLFASTTEFAASGCGLNNTRHQQPYLTR